MKMKLSVLHAAVLAATLAVPASSVQAALPFFNSDKQEMPSLQTQQISCLQSRLPTAVLVRQ